MTTNTDLARVQYNGNGATTAFAFNTRVLEDSHVKVIRRVTATGAETILTLDSGGADGFSVTGAGSSSATITVVTAPASGETLTIVRDVPRTQSADYVTNEPFPSESHEAALDKLTMIAQQQQDEIDRSLKFPETADPALVPELPNAPVDDTALVWDGVTGAVKNGPSVTDISNAAAAASSASDSASAASDSASAAADSASAAADSAAGVNLPPAGSGDNDKFLVVNDDEDGFELQSGAAIGLAYLGNAQSFTGGQRAGSTTLASSAGSINSDMDANNIFSITLTENATLENPSNVAPGQEGTYFITQDGTTARTLAYGSKFKFLYGVTPVMSTTLGAVCALSYVVKSTDEIICNLTQEFS
jgi:hypothetical protein